MSPVLDQFSTSEIEAELAKRKEKTPNPPQPFMQADWHHVRTTVCKGITQAHQDGYIDKNFHQHVYEAALAAVYGPNIWEWIRKRFP